MAFDPIEGVGSPTAAAASSVPYAPAAAYARAAGNAPAPAQETGGADADKIFQTKQGLDQREESWRAVAGGQGSSASGAGGSLADKTGDQVTDAELQRLFGSDASKVRDLLNARSNLTVGDILPLQKDSSGLEATAKLLTQRSDLNIDDVLSRDKDGNVALNPTMRDDQSMDLMLNRNDLKPGDLQNLGGQLAQAFGNPGMAKEAYQKSLELMKTRTDIKPQDMGKMVSTMSQALKQNSPKGDPASLQSMFNDGVETLKTRTDISPEEIGNLGQKTVQTFGSKNDPSSGTHISQAFSSANKMLQNGTGRSVSDASNLMDTMQERFPGDSGADRASAFDKATNLMTKMPQMNARGIDQMLQKSAEGPPPLKGDKLLQAFDASSQDVLQGRTTVGAATSQKSQQTDGQVRQEKALNKENRIAAGRLADPQEEIDSQKGRNDKQGNATTGGNAPSPREGALDTTGVQPGQAAVKPQLPG